jgi:uncharacterized protein (TIGR02147 family)
MDSTSNAKPKVYEYLDVGLYLRDYYQYRKAIRQGFSYEKWADELSFKSRSFLRMMVLGKKKLTPKLVESLAETLFSQKEEQEYFFCLVKYSQASGVKERHIFGQKMMQILKNHNQPSIITGDESFTSDPIYARLLSLFSYPDIEKSVSVLSQLISQGEDVTLRALDSLESWGHIKKDLGAADIRWSSSVGMFKVADNKGSKGIHKFHEKSLTEAIQAFEMPVSVRSYKSLLLPMSSEDFVVFNEMLNEFSKEQMARHNPKEYRGKRVYQVNFNIYPVTQELPELQAENIS